MFCIFDYDDEKWVSGIRKNAFQLSNNKFDALLFPSAVAASNFLSVLECLFPDISFSVIRFSE